MANYQPNYIYSPLYGNRYMGGSRTPAPSTGGTGQVDTTAIQSRNTAVGVPYSPVVQEQQGPYGFSSTGRDQSAVESLGTFGFRDMSGLTMDPFEGTDYLTNGFGSPAPINTRYVESVPEATVAPPVSFNGGGDNGVDNSAFRTEDALRMDTYSALGATNPEFNAQYSAYADAPLVEKIVGGVGLDMYRRANLKDAYNKEALAQGQVMDDVNLLDEYVFGVDPLPDSYRNTATIQDVASARSELAAQGANVSTGPAWDTTQGVYDETDYLDGGVQSYSQDFTQTTDELDADSLDAGNTGTTTTFDQNKLEADQEAQDQTGNPNASAVTNSQGEAVRSSSGSVVTSGTQNSGNDNSGGK
jgi:hypothetical protein